MKFVRCIMIIGQMTGMVGLCKLVWSHKEGLQLGKCLLFFVQGDCVLYLDCQLSIRPLWPYCILYTFLVDDKVPYKCTQSLCRPYFVTRGQPTKHQIYRRSKTQIVKKLSFLLQMKYLSYQNNIIVNILTAQIVHLQ